jgi:predicted phage terminase large subunit-like protein
MDVPLLAQRELNNRSFYEFLLFMWPEVSAEDFQPNWHIKLLCDTLQRKAERVVAEKKKPGKEKQLIKDLVVNVPPGTSKTTIVMIMFPAWCWTKWYWMEFIGLSYAATLSLESAEASRDLIRSDRYQMCYPELSIKPDKDQKSNFQILKSLGRRPGQKERVKQGGSRFSTSVGGSLTGFHGHIILVDDPINPQQAVSPVQLENTNNWMDGTLPTRKIHKGTSPMVMIMQRLHENDPTGHHIEKKGDKTDHICLPGEIRNYGKEVKPEEYLDLYSEDGLLDPTRMGWDALEDLESDLGQYGYAGQIGQSPTPPSGGMFKVDNFQTIDQLPQQHEIEMTVRYWDKAGTEAKNNSKQKGPAYSVGVKMSKLSTGKYLIHDVVRGRYSSENREAKIKATAEADGRDVEIGVEQEPGSGGKESAESTVRNLTGFMTHVDRPTGDKAYRADPYSVQVNWRNVYLLRGDWNSDYVSECRFFPHGNFKDQVDASSGAFALLNRRRKARAW